MIYRRATTAASRPPPGGTPAPGSAVQTARRSPTPSDRHSTSPCLSPPEGRDNGRRFQCGGRSFPLYPLPGTAPLPHDGRVVMPAQRNKTEDDITAEALQRFSQTPDPRLRQIMLGLIGHLHPFVKEVELTETEWFQAIEILTEAGRMCSDKRQEFILFSATLAVSMAA